MSQLRGVLNSAESVHLWIDLIFGAKSRGRPAIESKNLFSPSCYGFTPGEENTKAQFDAVLNYGAAPTQLFIEPHPPRRSRPPDKYADLLMMINDAGKSPACQQLNPLAAATLTKTSRIIIRNEKVEVSSVISDIRIGDGLCTCSIDAPSCWAFSPDLLFFAAVVGNGSMVAYALVKPDNPDLIASCSLPLNPGMEDCRIFEACAISSHQSLMIEASGAKVFSFHVASQRFIRTFQCDSPVTYLFISDSHHLILAIETQFIQVFTINGMPLAKGDLGRDPITCATLSSGENLLLATGHASGLVQFWPVDFHRGKVEARPFVDLKSPGAAASPIGAIGFVENGKGLVVVTGDDVKLYLVPNLSKPIVAISEVRCCAHPTCGKPPKEFCLRCGLYHCHGHHAKKRSTCDECSRASVTLT
jgi:WD40 repeat protein